MNTILILALAAQTQSLTVHDAVRSALAQHPAVAFADAHAARADHLVRELSATRLPQLQFESMVTRFQEPMVVAPLHGFDPRNPPIFDRTLGQANLSLGYTLLDASRGGRIARAEALAEAADAVTVGARAQSIAETVRAYLHARSAREIAAAQQKRLLALQRERDRARQLVDAGRAARVVLLRAEAAASAARAEAVMADSEVDVAQHDLARLLGVPVENVVSSALAGVRVRSASELERAALVAAAASQSPELLRLRLQREAARAERRAARGSWWPRVQVGGRFIEYASRATSPQGEWQGGAQLSYPIYSGGARAAAVDRTSAEMRAAEAELALGERRVGEAVDRALTAIAAARARVAALQAAVAQSEEVTRIDQLALEAGAGVQSDYLTAEAELLRARAALTEARAAEVLALVELARVTGELTEAWLTVHLESIDEK